MTESRNRCSFRKDLKLYLNIDFRWLELCLIFIRRLLLFHFLSLASLSLASLSPFFDVHSVFDPSFVFLKLFVTCDVHTNAKETFCVFVCYFRVKTFSFWEWFSSSNFLIFFKFLLAGGQKMLGFILTLLSFFFFYFLLSPWGDSGLFEVWCQSLSVH